MVRRFKPPILGEQGLRDPRAGRRDMVAMSSHLEPEGSVQVRITRKGSVLRWYQG